jgi:hypothetical protein
VDATSAEVDRWWQAFLRRLDIEHTFRLFKTLAGRTRRSGPRKPSLRTVVSTGNGWFLDDDSLQRESGAGFGNIRPTIALPAGAPKPSHDVGKTVNDRSASRPHETTQVKQEAQRMRW